MKFKIYVFLLRTSNFLLKKPMLASTLASLREIKFDLEYDARDKSACLDNDLNKAIIQTLSFFDIFDYPLTDWEVYKYLWVTDCNKKEFGYDLIKSALQNNLRGVSQEEGFYFCSANDNNVVALRKRRQIISRKKFRRARRVISLLSALPFVRMIAVCNSLAYDNAREESDIDIFMAVDEGKLWTARFFAITMLKLLRLRPTAATKKNKICLNFFISQNSLNLRDLMIRDDVYFIYWLRQLAPIYDSGGIFQTFVEENIFVRDFINNSASDRFNNKRKIKNGILAEGVKCFLEVLASWAWLEKLLKLAQLKMMPSDLKNNANKRIKENIEVAINDKMLKFHHGSKKEKFRDEWKERVAKLLNC